MKALASMVLLCLMKAAYTADVENVNATNSPSKRYTLSILNIMSSTGQLLLNGQACQAAVDIVAESVNARSDLLPDYRIETRPADEFMGKLAPRRLTEFQRALDDQPNEQLIRSPIIIGPQFSTGCKAIAPVLPHLHSVAISTYCTAPFFSDHYRTSNLYLALATQKTAVMAILKFMREIGHWNRFAILTNVGNINDYGSAFFLNEHATRLGQNVVWFDMIVDVDENTIRPLKELDVRIITIAMANDVIMCKILCEAYRQGLTGPRYVFVADIHALISPDELPDVLFAGCTKRIILEQLEHTFLIGIAFSPSEQDRARKSYLGHTWPEFERLLARKLTDTNSAAEVGNLAKPGDFMLRYLCYDSALKTVVTLDSTEKKLNRMNLSLYDYNSHPDIVAKLANESMAKERVPGLRVGDIAFNERGLLATEVMVIAKWVTNFGHDNLAVVEQLPNSTDFEFNSYHLRMVKNIQLPVVKDGRTTVIVNAKVPANVYITVLVLAILLGICEIGSVAFTVFSLENSDRANTFAKSKLLGYVGCFLIDTAAVLFAVPDVGEGTSTASIVLFVIGISIVHSVLTFRGIVMVYCGQTEQDGTLQGNAPSGASRSRSIIRPSSANRACSRAQRLPSSVMAKIDRLTIIASLAFLLLIVAVLICWLIVDPVQCTLEMLYAPDYDEASDIVLETWLKNCVSQNYMSTWIITIIILHASAFLFGALFAYRLGKRHPQVALIRAGLVNASALFIGGVLVVIILQNPINQRIAISFSILWLCAMNTAVSFYPTGRDLWRKHNHIPLTST